MQEFNLFKVCLWFSQNLFILYSDLERNLGINGQLTSIESCLEWTVMCTSTRMLLAESPAEFEGLRHHTTSDKMGYNYTVKCTYWHDIF